MVRIIRLGRLTKLVKLIKLLRIFKFMKSDKAKIEIVPVYVPALQSDGTPTSVVYHDEDGAIIEERDVAKPIVVSYLDDLQRQFADERGALGLVPDVLGDLLSDPADEVDAGSERETDSPY